MSTGRSAYLRGVGLWTPRWPSWAAWLEAGAPADLRLGPEEPGERPAARPPAALLHSRLRRRTSVLTRAAVTTLQEATGQGGASLDRVRYVLVSSFGEIETTVRLLAQLADPEAGVSPTAFHNSVHNTATGYMSIASGNHREATALAGGAQGLTIGLLEAIAGLRGGDDDVVLILAEEQLPPPFEREEADPTFAVALHLSGSPGRPACPNSLDLACELREREWPADTPSLELGGGGVPSLLAPLVDLLAVLAGAQGLGRRALEPTTVPLSRRRDPGVARQWLLSVSRS